MQACADPSQRICDYSDGRGNFDCAAGMFEYVDI
jgi:hypothetical protein